MRAIEIHSTLKFHNLVDLALMKSICLYLVLVKRFLLEYIYNKGKYFHTEALSKK